MFAYQPRGSDSKEEKKPSSEVCLCDLIYKAAKNPDKKEAAIVIQKLLNLDADFRDMVAFIDVVHNKKPVTASSLLAAEGDFEAVNFLRKEFHASTRWIIRGYAQGKYVIEVNKILAEAKTPGERFELLKFMAYGYSSGGHEAEANKVRALAATKDEQDILLDCMIFSYTLNRYVEKANKALESIEAEDRHLLNGNIASAHAANEDREQVNKIIASEKSKDKKLGVLSEVIETYARYGNVKEIKKAVELIEPLEVQFLLFKHMLRGYGRGGYDVEVRETFFQLQEKLDAFYNQGGSYEQVNNLLCLGKNLPRALQLRQILTYIASYYACGGHIGKAVRLYKEFKNFGGYSGPNILEGMIYGYAQGGGHAEGIYKIVSFVKQELHFLSHSDCFEWWFERALAGYLKLGWFTEIRRILEVESLPPEHHLEISQAIQELNPSAFSDEINTLQTLLALPQAFIARAAEEFKAKETAQESEEAKTPHESEKEINFSLLPKVNKLDQVMRKFGFNFHQAMCWVEPEILLLLLQRHEQKPKPLPDDLFFLLISYFIGNSITPEEILHVEKIAKLQLRYLQKPKDFKLSASPRITLFDAAPPPEGPRVAKDLSKVPEGEVINIIIGEDGGVTAPVVPSAEGKGENLVSASPSAPIIAPPDGIDVTNLDGRVNVSNNTSPEAPVKGEEGVVADPTPKEEEVRNLYGKR